MWRAFLIFSLFILPGISLGQQGRKDTLDIPRFYTNESQLIFSKRIWRMLDLRETQNKIITTGASPIQKLLYDAVLNGSLMPYLTDSLRTIISLNEFSRLGTDTILRDIPVDPSIPEVTMPDTIIEFFDPQRKVVKLLIMEDWMFDRKLAKRVRKIIAIAPLYRSIRYNDESGNIPLCWLKYDPNSTTGRGCRDLFQAAFVKDKRGADAMTYAAWFEDAWYSSVIVKYSNNRDYSISMQTEFKDSGIEALMEAERIRNQMYEDEENSFED